MQNNVYMPPRKAFKIVTGQEPHPASICRWALRGFLLDGERVILKTWMVGARRLTTVAEVEKFIEQRTIATTPPPTANPDRTRQELEAELAPCSTAPQTPANRRCDAP